MVKVSPSILSANFADLLTDLRKVENADFLHWDVMDGHYVPNISFGIPVMKSLKGKTKLPFDTHLMISNPDKYIHQFVEAGSQLITFHVEVVDDPEQTIELIRSQGAKAGISVNNKIAVEEVFPYLKKVDLVLVMSVEAGFSGQEFNPLAIEKIIELKKEISSQKAMAEISVDGGVTLENAKRLVKAGADILVAGSSIFGSPNPTETVGKMKKLG